ncbi:MAG: tetratricopeptide repeat protein [Pseudomonadota bacterium]|nr:tetratricopeptide repeat protein [Pseudomonadota bacterium]MDE3038446.1 tetratricopeptide repeat protein [Pseudomonadota bacterium]
MASGLALKVGRTAGMAMLVCLVFTASSHAADGTEGTPDMGAVLLYNQNASVPLKVTIPNLDATRQNSRPSSDIVPGGRFSDSPGPAPGNEAQQSFAPGRAPDLFKKFLSNLFPGSALPSLPEVLRASLPAATTPQMTNLTPAPIRPTTKRHVPRKHFAVIAPATLTIAVARPPVRKHFLLNAPVGAFADTASRLLPWLMTKDGNTVLPSMEIKEKKLADTDAPSPTHSWLSRFFAYSDNAASGSPDDHRSNLAGNVLTSPLTADPFNRQRLPETAVAAAPPWLSHMFAHIERVGTPTKSVETVAEYNRKSAVVKTLHSPGIIIKKELLHMATSQPGVAPEAVPEQLAALVPAAGGNAVVVPLIPLPASSPDQPTAAPLSSPPPSSLSPAVAASPETPAVNAMPEVKAPSISAPAQTTPAPVVTQVPKIHPLVEKDSSTNAVLRTVIEKLTAETPVPIDKPDINLPPISMEHKKSATLTTMATTKNIPASLGKKQKPPAPFSIERAREMNDLFRPEGDQAETSSQHKGLDIKVEVKKPSLDADYALQKAYDALTTGNTAAAIETYKTVLADYPDNTNALFGLATLYHRAGDLGRARALYGKLLTIDPNNRDGWNNFLALMADESPKDAAAHLEILESKNPNFSPIPAQLAIIYQKLGEADKAVSRMVRAIDLAPDNLTYRYDLAIMLDKQGKYADAAKFYKQIIEAYQRGASVPGNIQKIQQRLTFISSNRP